MKLAHLFLTIVTLVCFQSISFSQDTLLLMSGQQVSCEIIDDLGIEIRYWETRKNGKKKERYLHKSDIFSITKIGQTEEVYYAKDELLGDWMTEDEMRIFMAGEQDARAYYNEKPTMIVGFAFGNLVSILATGGLIVTISGPLLYTLFHMIPVIKIKESAITNADHQYNEIYALGFERVARSRKIVAALKGSAAGMLTGLATYLLFFQK